MPHFLGSEPVETILANLADALDQIDVGIVLLDRDLRVQFTNRRFAQIWGEPPDLLGKDASFRMLLENTAARVQYGVTADDLPAFLDQREASVRAAVASAVEIDLRDGRRFLVRSSPCRGDGRILTYDDITPLQSERKLLDDVRQAAERMLVEQRFNVETMEGQAAYLASLAETADENAREAAVANQRLEHEITERRQLEAELRRLATTDALTGILNRAQFFLRAQHELERAHRHHQAMTVLMLDIDYFKRINDTYGHFIGDEVLKHVAAELRACMPGADLLGRLGGEEFAIILPEADGQAGLQIGERLRARIAGSPTVQGDRTISVTVSIGLATVCDNDGKIEHALARADAMLYAAKTGGRNQVRATVAETGTALV
jgi:diguanylate cyclase (GGDEF)-like protein